MNKVKIYLIFIVAMLVLFCGSGAQVWAENCGAESVLCSAKCTSLLPNLLDYYSCSNDCYNQIQECKERQQEKEQQEEQQQQQQQQEDQQQQQEQQQKQQEQQKQQQEQQQQQQQQQEQMRQQALQQQQELQKQQEELQSQQEEEDRQQQKERKTEAALSVGCDTGNFNTCLKGFLYYDARGIYDSSDIFFKKMSSLKGAKYFRSKCNKSKQASSCYILGKMYIEGIGINKDYQQALLLYKKACYMRNAMGCNNLGVMYLAGFGINKDYQKALSLFKKACDMHNMSGCNNLGSNYVNGFGVDKNPMVAVSFYQKACDGGNTWGCIRLGSMYKTGSGINENFLIAASLYKKACYIGNAYGCNVLGAMYSIGNGVNKNPLIAASLFKQACEGGYANGCSTIGNMYNNGSGVVKDLSKAASFYKKACNGGSADGCNNLGGMYYNGNGVDKDLSIAASFYNKACDGGNADGCNHLNSLPGKLVVLASPITTTVFLDGKVVGQTPYTGVAVTGTHTVRVLAEGYKSQEKSVLITANTKLNVSFALEKGDNEPSIGIGEEVKPEGTKGGPMVYIPAGWFWMGCSPNDGNCSDNEKPYHRVYLDAYYIDKNDVTKNEYSECVDAGVCTQPDTVYYCYWGFSGYGNYPINCVDWDQANVYCKWAGKQLPTEAQWEKAARGTDGRIYPWGNHFDCDMFCNGEAETNDRSGDSCAIGSHPQGASPYGVMDMEGNDTNWCSDLYDANYYTNSPDYNPKGPDSGTMRVLRGSSSMNFCNDYKIEPSLSFREGLILTFLRGGDYPSTKNKTNYGFRCADSVSQKTAPASVAAPAPAK